VDSDATGVSRDDLMLRLKAQGIGTGLHYPAIHLSRFYAKRYGWARGDFPHAEYISDRIISLPLFPDMTEADQDRVVAAVAEICGAIRT
jgi:dTDP-4-amino-4,6-dideoxygalactose transaminase